jgi:periplasmic protein TonB
MFERYMGAKQEKPNKWVSLTITVSAALHVVGGIALLIYSFWKIDKLPVKDTSVLYMAAQMATPPPPPPPPPPPKKSSVKKDIVKPKSTEVVQPNKNAPKPEPEEADNDDEGVEGGVAGGVKGGVIGGVEGGVVGGVEGGVGTAAPPPAPAVQNIAQQMLEGQRIAGDKMIQLGDQNNTMLRNQGVSKMTVRVKMCIATDGSPRSVEFTKGSGYAEVDARIRGEMNKWRYRPYMVNGKPMVACFPVTFNYTITQ